MNKTKNDSVQDREQNKFKGYFKQDNLKFSFDNSNSKISDAIKSSDLTKTSNITKLSWQQSGNVLKIQQKAHDKGFTRDQNDQYTFNATLVFTLVMIKKDDTLYFSL